MSVKLTDDGAERLALAIVRRAYEDYYTSCAFPHKLPKRPKIVHMVNGKFKKELATDHEYHEWLVAKFRRMQNRRDEVEYFLWSQWYDTLVDMEPDGKTERINKIIEELVYRRKNGIGLFENGETEEEEEDGYSSVDSW